MGETLAMGLPLGDGVAELSGDRLALGDNDGDPLDDGLEEEDQLGEGDALVD